jgi:hypothetical protein
VQQSVGALSYHNIVFEHPVPLVEHLICMYNKVKQFHSLLVSTLLGLCFHSPHTQTITAWKTRASKKKKERKETIQPRQQRQKQEHIKPILKLF